MYDFMRVACAVPPVRVADGNANLAAIEALVRRADSAGADWTVFPELALTGYTCGDLFFQSALTDEAAAALGQLARLTGELHTAVSVGLPLRLDGRLFNCAALLAGGRVCGLVPKTFLPNYGEFYERRWFASSEDLTRGSVVGEELGIPGAEYEIPVGRGLVFELDGVRVGMELCEDVWAPLPPSTLLTLGGAELIANLSASNETIQKRAYRTELVCQQSARCLCGYLYASAGALESTTDLVFSGHCLIAENGALLAETPSGLQEEALLLAETDVGRIRADRLKNTTFRDAARVYGQPCRTIRVRAEEPRGDGTLRSVEKLPFVPSSRAHRVERCREIFEMQVAGLKKRLRVTGSRPVIGVSGGLDSTLALLVCAQAVRELGRPADDVYAVTMPCFGTSDRTCQNARRLMETLGVTSAEINLRAACELHFRDIGHDPSAHDGTYENSQARERTQVLMDCASRVGGFVVGTGDLSELALGWCTYNGDHMSMYAVNTSVPKTLVRWMIDSLTGDEAFASSADTLRDILDTPISPELLPPDENGQIAQVTEDVVGPYALHDFFLYYLLRFGFAPSKIYALALRAFREDFDRAVILKWMKVFYRRFFSQQFKRSCMPDGVKVGSVCLSPRGDWRMPSDASAALWLDELERLEQTSDEQTAVRI